MRPLFTQRSDLALVRLLAVALAFSGCSFDASHPFRCGPNGACPQGRSCYADFCVLSDDVQLLDGSLAPPAAPTDAASPPELPPEDASPAISADAESAPQLPPPDASPPAPLADAGTFDCGSSSNCAPSCAAGTSCNVQCNSASNCELACRGSCVVACERASNCRADCRGESCDITCPSEGNCDEIRCRHGAACLLRCQERDNCAFEECEGRETACSPTLRACNRDCP